ncbi:MAG: acetyl-CoA acetyltransferase [Bacillota bacterium]|nr:acetyl-CoA acetyltransferase [Bacillota bacterium]
MKSIKDRVAIIGMGCTKFGELWDWSLDDLIVEACYEALQDAGIETSEIQAAWLGTFTSGRRGATLAGPLKLMGVPVSRVENACATGTDAFRNAAYAVAAGTYDIVLVCGVEKLKDYGFSGLPAVAPSYAELALSQTKTATSMAAQFALLANRYFHHYGIGYAEAKTALAKIAVKNHHNGALNPKAHFKADVSLEQVMNAPMIARPLGLFDCCAVSDGGAAAIITRPEIARKYRKDYVLVKGIGLANGDEYAQLTPNFDWTHWEENVIAAKIAYEDAGITNPREELDMAIVHDCFTINELVTYEDLGFSPRGKAIDDVSSGFFELDGGLPVNTDGGLKSFGHPIGATGIRMIYEVYKQLQGKAGPRQLSKVKLGLTHNIGGTPGSFTSAVAIFGRDK